MWGSLVAALLALCVILGGGATAGYLGDVILQLVSIPVLLVALSRMRFVDPRVRGAVLFCSALVLIPLIQLIPLPPAVWTKLPWRDVAAQALTLSGQEVGWRPLTLTPHATWLCLASLVPPLAIFFATLQLNAHDRRRAVGVLLGVGLLASFIGLLQVALGPNGAIVDFGPSSLGEATGFFANRNHFAALLYVLLIFAAVFALNSVKALPATPETRPDTATLIGIVASFTVVVVLLGAELMARSRAGIGLTMVALLGIAALASSDSRGSGAQRANANRLIGGAVTLVLLFGAQFALFRIMDRFAADPLSDARLVFARNTWAATLSFLPFGSGLGSFVPVYQVFEKPQDALVDVYANRAHNEVLDLGLETGVLGLILIGVFVVWLLRRSCTLWRTEEQKRWAPFDLLLARAATLILVLLAAHSLVEYPLRTTALMAVAAFACALLFPPMGDTRAQGSQSLASDRTPVKRTANVEMPPVSRAFEGVGVGPSVSSQRTSAAEVWAWPDETRLTRPPASSPTGELPGARTEKADAPASSPTGPSGASPAQPQDLWGDAMAWPAAWQKKAKDAHGPQAQSEPIQDRDTPKPEDATERERTEKKD